ncbi:MAG: SIR2 family protein [Promethearchaeota archaeon]
MIKIDGHVLEEILEIINQGKMILFLGSGSTRMCKKQDGTPGLTGSELSLEILKELNRGKNPQLKVSLAKAAEFYVTSKPSARIGLDELIQGRLAGLQPTLGHFFITLFPWKAIITTNYNMVIEEAYKIANQEGFALRNLRSLRYEGDLDTIEENSDISLYKPHGCISLESDVKDRLIITPKDYFDSIGLRPKMYKKMHSMVKENSTLFIGYSMDDYTFRNIYYDAYDQVGSLSMRSFNVNPVHDQLLFKWMSQSLDKDFNTTAINGSFDAFMVQLLLYQGKGLPSTLKSKILNTPDNNLCLDDNSLKQLKALLEII